MIYVRIEYLDINRKLSIVDAYRKTFNEVFKFLSERADNCPSDKKIYKVYITNLIKLEVIENEEN